MRLSSKVAIVTGSGHGIGREIATVFAREGASVFVNDIDAEAISRVVDEIKDEGGTAYPIKANVADKTEVQKLCETVTEKCGGIHILVNNAMIRRNASLLEVSEEDWDVVLSVGLKGVFFCIQAAAKYMIPQHYGKIINISSLAALGACGPNHSIYAAVKAGVIALTKVAALTLGPQDINVNCIAPGVIDTPQHYARRGKEGAEKFFEEKKRAIVLGRVGTPEDIANLALFLASDDANYITGQVIACEGGRTDLMLR
ncbi:SDR family NAD(P)-dependent oxidoreductase [Chloroflexota bacterium]